MAKSKNFRIVNIANTSDQPTSSVLIIYTGGTFGMVYDHEGQLVPFNFSLVVEKVPELSKLDLKLTVISFPQPVDSSNMKLTDWQNMAHIIYSNYDNYDGFVILHGTDTMAYSASVLSFMFDGLNKPIIFTGAQIPIGATRSDARENLITALEIASYKLNGKSVINEVAIYFNHYLLRGNRSQKVRSSNFGAFESINYPYLAESGIQITYNTSFLSLTDPSSQLEYFPMMNENIAILKLFPNISADIVKAILNIPNLQGVVLESFGSGNTMNGNWFLDLLKKKINEGLIVLNVSQCLGGSVVHGRYATSKRLPEIGVVSGGDITTEAAIAKLMHLIGTESSSDIIKKKLAISLRGEMTTLQS